MMGLDSFSRVSASALIPALFPMIILLAVAMWFVLSALLQWLWNITITRIFGVREITYWEAFRLLLIAGILFGRSVFWFRF